MELTQLRIQNLRVIERLELDLAPGWNLLIGPNGAGKTSLLEAAYLLSHGRSFRTSLREALVRHGSAGYAIYGEVLHASGQRERLGLARDGARLQARIDGTPVAAATLLRHAAVLCFEPGSHELIAGAADNRRSFLDWGVFHVEHEFLPTWRRCQRALKQRNALLRNEGGAAGLDAWDHELAAAAEPLTAMRQRYVEALRPILAHVLGELLGELGAVELGFEPGFDPERPLLATLAARRGLDLARGYTSAGPQRADWTLGFPAAPRREHLSRGQQKLAAFACVVAQARLFARTRGEWPVLCLDDLASEVDAPHQTRMLATLQAAPAQVLLTGTEAPAALAALTVQPTMFHVEHGRVARLL
ncbi:MAG: DNA replication/repair protein RecF [Rhodanobacteraceae bacterium]|nr:DNA replication/repair protein RecF [Rhodanobacteraceae bacterium]